LHGAGTPAADDVRESYGGGVAIRSVIEEETVAGVMVITVPNLALAIVGAVDHVAVSCNAVDSTVVFFVFPAESCKAANMLHTVRIRNAEARLLGL